MVAEKRSGTQVAVVLYSAADTKQVGLVSAGTTPVAVEAGGTLQVEAAGKSMPLHRVPASSASRGQLVGTALPPAAHHQTAT